MNSNNENTPTKTGAATQSNPVDADETIASAIADESNNLIAVGQQRIHVNAVTTKIREDIAFLEDRIQPMESMSTPSETVLNTYRAMLTSRKSVLSWLEEHHMMASVNNSERTGT